MLTLDLLRVRNYKGELRPRYIEVAADENLALAESLIEIFRAHRGRPRHELDRELTEYLGTGTDFLLHRALAKLLHDRSSFETEAPGVPEELRRAVFAAAAATYRSGEERQGEELHPFSFERQAVLVRAAGDLGTAEPIAPSALDAALYADLKDQQILREFEGCTPRFLLERYNVALAQGVLLRASELTVEISGQNAKAYRELFRKVKFFQLLHRIEAFEGGGGYRIVLDGPMSLFKASGKYGLQMAVFLPTLLHFQGWTLHATIHWGKRRLRRRFELSSATGLVSHTRLRGQWQPEELSFFPEQFAKLEGPWEISTETELIDLGDQGVLIPDYVFRHQKNGRRVVMEVLGFWRKGAVASRLALLRRSCPEEFILAISKGLAGGQEGIEDLPAEIYVFRRTPLARQVLKRLEERFGQKKRRRRATRR